MNQSGSPVRQLYKSPEISDAGYPAFDYLAYFNFHTINISSLKLNEFADSYI
jgi:hypothetical protein